VVFENGRETSRLFYDIPMLRSHVDQKQRVLMFREPFNDSVKYGRPKRVVHEDHHWTVGKCDRGGIFLNDGGVRYPKP